VTFSPSVYTFEAASDTVRRFGAAIRHNGLRAAPATASSGSRCSCRGAWLSLFGGNATRSLSVAGPTWSSTSLLHSFKRLLVRNERRGAQTRIFLTHPDSFHAVLERLSFGANVAFRPGEDLLHGVTVAPLTTPLAAGAPVQAAIFRLAAKGRIARHPATVPQVLAVLEGTGRVSGADGNFERIAASEAVFWAAGEEHETETEDGLTALVLEADGLQLFHRPSGPHPSPRTE